MSRCRTSGKEGPHEATGISDRGRRGCGDRGTGRDRARAVARHAREDLRECRQRGHSQEPPEGRSARAAAILPPAPRSSSSRAIRSARSGAGARSSSASSRRAQGWGRDRRRRGRHRRRTPAHRRRPRRRCAGCHGRPRGSAGHGGDVVTRPDSRDAPHLFGLGLQEMLADEITTDLRAIRAAALDAAARHGTPVTRALRRKGISYGIITADADGTFDTSRGRRRRSRPARAAVLRPGRDDLDPRVRRRRVQRRDGPGGARPRLWRAAAAGGAMRDAVGHGARRRARQDRGAAGDVGDGRSATATASSTRSRTSIVDFMEFYLLNYFKPATRRADARPTAVDGRTLFTAIGCTTLPRADPDDRPRPPRRRRGDRLQRSRDQGILQPAVRDRDAAASSTIDDGSRLPDAQAAGAAAVRRAQHLHRLQAPRSGPELPRAQLRRHAARRSS